MLFVSSQFYALGRQLGLARAMRTIQLQIDKPDLQSEPAVRTIARLRSIEPIQLRVDTGAVCIGKTRSRTFHDAYEVMRLNPDCDVWLAIDDDCEATSDTLRAMLATVRTSRGICIAPFLLRQGSSETKPRLSVEIPRAAVANVLSESRLMGRQVQVEGSPFEAIVIPCPRRTNGTPIGGGFGLVALHRQAMQDIAANNTHMLWLDDDGHPKLAVFHEILAGDRWLGEDLSFFARVPPHVEVEILVTGHTSHAGEGLDLESIAAYLVDPSPERDSRRDPELAPITEGRPNR